VNGRVDGEAKKQNPDGTAPDVSARTRRRRGPWVSVTALVALLAICLFLVMRQGVLPSGYSPLPALDLSVPNAWFVDWRIAELKRNRALCSRVLKPPVIAVTAVSDNPIKDGCGWENAVRLSNAGGAAISVRTISCEVAAAFAMWMAHEVQPRAMAQFGARVASIDHAGIYACRNIRGRKLWVGVRSEHATANAIDISGFTLAGGRWIGVEKHWSGSGPEARFLREIHASACRYFRVAIGPEFNEAHHDHFHFDRGILSRCK
jgi:hypothetical protein